MYKGKIELGGVTMRFDCETFAQLAAVLAKYEGCAVSVIYEDSGSGSTDHVVKVTPKSVKRVTKATRGNIPWSEKDIIAIGTIVRDNIKLHSGISLIVSRYLRNNGDHRNRTKATIYTVTCDIKRYLKTGKKKGISKNILTTLDKGGIRPELSRPSFFNNPKEA